MFQPAIVQVCFVSGDWCFRCPNCDSLNIDDMPESGKCPDCGAEFVKPCVTECDCKNNENN